MDSDDEWEEEEPGESLSHSEGVSFTVFFLFFFFYAPVFCNYHSI